MDKSNNKAQQDLESNTHPRAEIGLLGLQGTATLSKCLVSVYQNLHRHNSYKLSIIAHHQ